MSDNRISRTGGPSDNLLPRIAEGLRKNRVALLLALLLNIGDVLTTHIGLARGLPEGNLIPSRLLAYGGQFAMFGIKFAVLAAALLLVSLLGRRYPRLWHIFTVTNLVMLVAVLSNTAQIVAR